MSRAQELQAQITYMQGLDRPQEVKDRAILRWNNELSSLKPVKPNATKVGKVGAVKYVAQEDHDCYHCDRFIEAGKPVWHAAEDDAPYCTRSCCLDMARMRREECR